MRIFILVLGVLGGGSLFGQAEDCDCPYPIVFMHGWAGGETSWENYSQELASVYGDEIIVPDMSAPNPKGTVYYANLNFRYGQKNMFGPDLATDAAPDFGGYVDDDVIVHEQFINAPELIYERCLYVVSFSTKKDLIHPVNSPVLVTSSSPNWNANTTQIPSDESTSNQSSLRKQGYALGRAIAEIIRVSGKNKVVLVTHSMGGLAAREYLQRSSSEGYHDWWVDRQGRDDGHRVAKLLTVGSPHRGSNILPLEDLFDSESLADIIGLGPLSVQSEAVRDLRYYYYDIPSFSGQGYDPNNASMPPAGIALFSGNETNLSTLSYDNIDVDCDGKENSINVRGLNNSVGTNPWDGTSDNPNLKLPTNVKYTYYVSDAHNTVELLAINKFVNRGISFLKPELVDAYCNVQEQIQGEPLIGASFYEASDGIVPSDRQWIYNGGNGSTDDFEMGRSVPSPLLGGSLANAHIVSDRITTPNETVHLNDLGILYGSDFSGFLCGGLFGLIDNIANNETPALGMTNDFNVLSQGIDEGDFPAFAHEIEVNSRYFGLPQKRADIVAENSNPDLGFGTANPRVDADWYSFELEENVEFIDVELFNSLGLRMLVDLYIPRGVSDFSNANSPMQIDSPQGGNLRLNSCDFLPEGLPSGKWYLRITSDLTSLGNISEAWKFPYKFKVVPIKSKVLSVQSICVGTGNLNLAIEYQGQPNTTYMAKLLDELNQEVISGEFQSSDDGMTDIIFDVLENTNQNYTLEVNGGN